MTMRSLLLIGTVLLAAVPATARAQAPASPSTPHPPTATQGGDAGTTAQRCAPNALSEQNRRPGTTTGQADNAPLSDKLAEGHGVLCPPAGIDPEIRAPTPNVGKMPVIPPPGSPGGDPSIQPK